MAMPPAAKQMISNKRFIVMCFTALFVAAAAAGHPHDDGEVQGGQNASVLTPAVWSVVAAPVQPVRGTDGRIHLAYELMFTNVSSLTLRLDALHAVDPGEGNRVVGVNRILAAENEDVTGELRPLALPTTFDKSNYSKELGPGQSAIIYMDVTVNDHREVPSRLAHRITTSLQINGQQSTFTAVGGFTKVNRADAVVLSPPLRGDRWVNGNGCCAIIAAHRFTMLAVNGTLKAPEHFAIDYIQLDAQGRAYVGDSHDLNSWHYFGAEIISAAPGKVVEAVDKFEDQRPPTTPNPVTLENAAGNHVIVDIGDGRYALYAHLKQGSVAVRKGQRVTRGEKLGLLGNSGNSDAPHLHFQIMDRPSTLDANGLPFVFDRFEFQGRIALSAGQLEATLAAGGSPPIDLTGTGVRRRQMPLTLDVTGFR